MQTWRIVRPLYAELEPRRRRWARPLRVGSTATAPGSPSGGSAGSPADQGDHQSRRTPECPQLPSRCKTFRYGQAIQARQEAERSGVDDACCATQRTCRGTVAVCRLPAGRWPTPTLSSGCCRGDPSAGTGARPHRGSSIGRALQPGDQAALVNSLTGRQSLDGLPPSLSDDGPALWRTSAVAETISTLPQPITPISCQPGIRR